MQNWADFQAEWAACVAFSQTGQPWCYFEVIPDTTWRDDAETDFSPKPKRRRLSQRDRDVLWQAGVSWLAAGGSPKEWATKRRRAREYRDSWWLKVNPVALADATKLFKMLQRGWQ